LRVVIVTENVTANSIDESAVTLQQDGKGSLVPVGREPIQELAVGQLRSLCLHKLTQSVQYKIRLSINHSRHPTRDPFEDISGGQTAIRSEISLKSGAGNDWKDSRGVSIRPMSRIFG